jgi:hypothetical protein
MTTLVVEPLITTLEQTITLNLKQRYIIAAIRPYVYMHNNPAGTFTYKLKSGATELWQSSFTSVAIKTALNAANNYAHIKLNLISDYLKLSPGSYTVELSSSGYTYNDSSYMGWIKPHEDLFNDIDGTPDNDFSNPLGVQMLSENNIERVR